MNGNDTTGEIFSRLNKTERWCAHHDGTCTERNKAREKFERDTKQELTALDDRMARIELRVAGWAGGMALLGALAGGGLLKVLTVLFGE